MPPSIEFDGGFDIDLDEATTFLVEQSIAIAERFAAFFEASVERVLEFPHSGSPVTAARDPFASELPRIPLCTL